MVVAYHVTSKGGHCGAECLVLVHSSCLRTSLFRFVVSALVGGVMLKDARLGRMSLAPQSAGKSYSG